MKGKQTIQAAVAVCLLSAGLIQATESKPAATEQPTATATSAAQKNPVKQPAGDEAVIKIELPRPRFVGTPTSLKSARLDPALKGEKREPFTAPAGVKNVALNKPVSASDEEPIIGELEMATDGDKEGRDGSFVELGPGVQYVQIDLEQEYEIYAIVIWHYHSMARVYRDVIVEVADDVDFIDNVRTVFNNDHDNSCGKGIGKGYEYVETYEGRLIPVDKQKARYVRLYSNGSTASEMNHYTEVEVYGK